MVTNSYSDDPSWYIDTGVTDHITSDLDKLSVKDKYYGKDQVQVASGSGLAISHTGHSQIPSLDRPLNLNNIFHVPKIKCYLLSVHRFTKDNNVLIEFHHDLFFVKD